MNRIVVFDLEQDQLQEGSLVQIKELQTVEHIHTVLNSQKGDHLKVCLLNQGLAEAQIITLEPDSITLKIQKIEKGFEPLFSLEVGLCRPPTIKKLLEHGSSLGVGQFTFFHAQLSEKSYAQSKVFQDHTAEKIALDGLAQSAVFYRKPSIHILPPGQKLPHSSDEQKYFLSLEGKETFLEKSIDFNKGLTLALGPERGWTPEEERELEQRGYQAIKIAPSILRVEIAAFSALGQLHLLAMPLEAANKFGR